MSERPIIFSTPMVKAILDGRKTVTRRIAWRRTKTKREYGPAIWMKIHVGDRLWVREAFAPCEGFALYRADEPKPTPDRWSPSIHMPRWASRITLEVTAVRLEQLQEITEADCLAEGPYRHDEPSQITGGIMVLPEPEKPWLRSTPRAWYRELWDSLHGSGAWAANPEVVVISFRRIPQP